MSPPPPSLRFKLLLSDPYLNQDLLFSQASVYSSQETPLGPCFFLERILSIFITVSSTSLALSNYTSSL